jgi:predicted transcriptional regulator
VLDLTKDSPAQINGQIQRIIRVPEADWNEEAIASIGIDAPELHPSRLLDTNRIAAILGVTPSAVRSYVTKGLLPPATVQGLASPLWSFPALIRHLRSRQTAAEERSRARLDAMTKTRKKPAKTTTKSTGATANTGKEPAKPRLEPSKIDELLARIDAELGLDHHELDNEIEANEATQIPEEPETYSDRYRY